jgi:trk system potassium uptake protein
MSEEPVPTSTSTSTLPSDLTTQVVAANAIDVVIVGCGRVGSTLAHQLLREGRSVCVVDKRADSFRRLGENFAGRTVVGIGFDQEVLAAAGVTQNTAVAAVTNGDNSNILIARVARELFGAQRVVARIYDPQRATVYGRLGISTVASVAWTVGRVSGELFPDLGQSHWSDPTETIDLRELRIPASLAGMSISAFEAQHRARIISVNRNGSATLAETGALLQQDDHIHIAINRGHSIELTTTAERGH